MGNKIRFRIDGGPTQTTSTTQITLGSFDRTNVPGFGSINGGTPRWGAVITSRVVASHNGGDHGTKIWEIVTGLSHNAGGGFAAGTAFSANSQTGGVLIANGTTPPSGTFLWDLSTNDIRFRITPAVSTAMYWMVTHDVEIHLES